MTQTSEQGRRWGMAGLVVTAAVLLGAWWMLDGRPGSGDDGEQPPAAVPVAQVTKTELPNGRSAPERTGDAPGVSGQTPAALRPTGDTLSVLVTGRARGGAIRPVTSADVVPLVDGQPGTRRRTDAAGRTAIPLPEVMGATLIVRAPGSFVSVTDIEDVRAAVHAGETFEVRIEWSYVLQGKVGAWGPDPLPAGIAVLAWAGSEPPSRDEVLALLEQEHEPSESPGAVRPEGPRGPMLTRTQFGGRYRFGVRLPAGKWTLLAAGLGRATLSPVRVSVEAGKGVSLTTWSAHSLAVQVTDHQGAPIEETPGLSTRGTSWPQGSKLQYIEFSPAERLLLGVEVPAAWGRVQLLDVRAPEPSPMAGPVHINLREPGFENLSVELDVPCTTSGLLLHPLAMQPTWEELGELTVVLQSWSDHLGPLTEPPLVSLNLTTSEGDRRHIYLKDIADDRVMLSGIPHGSWKASLDVQGMFLTPKISEPVEISARPATLLIDLTPYARLDVELVTPDDSAYEGRASLFMELMGGSPQGGGLMYAFKGPPYRIPFVALYRWKLHLWDASGLGAQKEGTARAVMVELSAGEEGSARLVVGGS